MFRMSDHCRTSRRLQSHDVSTNRAKPYYMIGSRLNNSRCRCKSQFCYECGRKWKNCTCVVYDEDMLLQRAQLIANRLAGPGAAVMVAPRGERVQQIARELRECHDCDHTRGWRRVHGPHRCEECRDLLYEFILECRHCRLQACVRCMRNRL